jgi:RNA polymerase sigma factor (sigma-70 family)
MVGVVMVDNGVDQRVATAYTEHRPAMLSVAYRMLGSFTDAEDIVQEAILRFRRALTAGEDPQDERAYLVTITTRLAIDEMRSARARRETYVGPWLPEPAVEGWSDLAEHAATADSLSTALLLLLERLGPEQRAALLLRDVFAYPYADIAEILGKTQAACRQLASRARRLVQDSPEHRPVDRDQARVLLDGFFRAARDGDLDRLVGVLAPDVRFVGDGGSSGRGLPRIVRGRDEVARLVQGLVHRVQRWPARVEYAWVGTQPALLILDGSRNLLGVWTLVVDTSGIHAVHGIVNPEKLRHLGAPTAEAGGGSPASASRSETTTTDGGHPADTDQ